MQAIGPHAQKTISSAKDMMALLRDLLLFIIALLLLFFPGVFNNILIRAGFEEGEIVGLKWKKSYAQNDQALKEARVVINDLRDQLTITNKSLDSLKAQMTDPKLLSTVENLQARNNEIGSTSGKRLASVSKVIEMSAPLVENAQRSVAPESDWGVVYAGDANLQGAAYEVTTIAKKFNLPGAAIYFRQGSYRSVAVTDSRQEAEEILTRAKKRRGDAYIVSMSGWCPNAEEKEGYLKCRQ